MREMQTMTEAGRLGENKSSLELSLQTALSLKRKNALLSQQLLRGMKFEVIFAILKNLTDNYVECS